MGLRNNLSVFTYWLHKRTSFLGLHEKYTSISIHFSFLPPPLRGHFNSSRIKTEPSTREPKSLSIQRCDLVCGETHVSPTIVIRGEIFEGWNEPSSLAPSFLIIKVKPIEIQFLGLQISAVWRWRAWRTRKEVGTISCRIYREANSSMIRSVGFQSLPYVMQLVKQRHDHDDTSTIEKVVICKTMVFTGRRQNRFNEEWLIMFRLIDIKMWEGVALPKKNNHLVRKQNEVSCKAQPVWRTQDNEWWYSFSSCIFNSDTCSGFCLHICMMT